MADWTEKLVTEARTLAGQGYYVLGPPDDPDHATAFRAIQQLEAVGHPTALERAGELRQEFAAALIRQADDLWEQDGGKQFAVDFYIQAHQLDPENERAATRTEDQGEAPVGPAIGAARGRRDAGQLDSSRRGEVHGRAIRQML